MFSRRETDEEAPEPPLFVTPKPQPAERGGVTPPDDFQLPWPGEQQASPVPEETFSSVDDALPAASTSDPSSSSFAPPRILSRLFTRGRNVDDHEGRIDAAASALDGVGAQLTEGSTAAPADLPIIDIGEIEVKTDEFAIATPDAGDSSSAHVDGDTLDVDQHGFWSALLSRLFGSKRGAADKAAEQSDSAQAAAVFLLAKFRAFYNEIIRFQHQKSEFTAGFATAVMAANESAESDPEAAAESLSKRLSELLDLQAAEAKWMGGEVAQRYPDAQYAMAALADEIFTHMEWNGQTAWPKHRLEAKMFRTHGAELEVYKRIDKLLKELPDTVVARDLARVYLLVLAAGFQGKWRPFGLSRPIAEYRRRLYEYVHGADPLMLYAADRRIFPEAASRTLAGQAISRYSAAQRWAVILAILVVTYTVVAHVAWSRASSDLKDVTTRIKSSTSAGAP